VVVNDANTVVPVWTLATSDVNIPAIAGTERMTPQRLNDLRTALAALAETPIVALEAHPMPENLDRSRGRSFRRDSPLAQHLSRLITETTRSAPDAPVEVDKAQAEAAQAGPLAEAQAQREVLATRTGLAQRAAELRQQELVSEVVKPAERRQNASGFWQSPTLRR